MWSSWWGVAGVCVEQRWTGPVICSAGISGVTPDYTQQIPFFLFNQHKSGSGCEGGVEGWGGGAVMVTLSGQWRRRSCDVLLPRYILDDVMSSIDFRQEVVLAGGGIWWHSRRTWMEWQVTIVTVCFQQREHVQVRGEVEPPFQWSAHI